MAIVLKTINNPLYGTSLRAHGGDSLEFLNPGFERDAIGQAYNHGRYKSRFSHAPLVGIL